MKIEIKHRDSLIFSIETDSLEPAVEADIKSKADQWKADLWKANLREAELREANLRGVKMKFKFFPSIRFLSTLSLGKLPDNICLELMRRDASGHPNPEEFNKWANGGGCPYVDVERFWCFEPKKELWKPGKPEMEDRDLIMAICKHKEWKITNYLEG